ncbi:MAG: hypothetical protein QOD84_114 [Acidobacteriaceae bacterium]|jgi:hypothetical protein
MKKLDRLVWAAGISFTSYGVRIGVRTNTPELLDKVLPHLPAGWKIASSPVVGRLYSAIQGSTPMRSNVRSFHLLYANLERRERLENLDHLVESLVSDIETHIAQATRQRLFLHAGVVGWMGRAIVFPGRSLSGKSTLTREFLRAGAEYFSDEFAVLDAEGGVHPFPRPLSIRDGDPQNGNHTRFTAEELGAKAGKKPLPLSLVVLARYKEGARWRPRVISQGQGVLGLMANAVAARNQPHRALVILEKTMRQAHVLRGTRGEAKETVESILRYLENSD